MRARTADCIAVVLALLAAPSVAGAADVLLWTGRQ